MLYHKKTHTDTMKNLEETMKSSRPILIDFYASWGGPCKRMHPVIDEVEKHVGNKAKVIKIDIDTNKALATEWGIRSVPTIVIVKYGEIKFRQSGVQAASDLIKELEKWM